MRSTIVATALAACVAALASPSPRAQVPAAEPPAPTQDKHLTRAQNLHAEGKTEEATGAIQRALERDDRNLAALAMLAALAQQSGNLDQAVHALHRWMDVADAMKKSAVPAKDRKATSQQLLELDPEARAWDKLQRRYVTELVKLGKEYKKRKDWLGGLDLFKHILQVDPQNRSATASINEIQRLGGEEVAVEDVFAGADPTFGKSAEQIRRDDLKHSTWQTAWKKDTDNYSYRTDAGFLILETSSIAMEQVNRFYRKFFRHKEKGGKTPKIQVRIFKSREEYFDKGSSPREWSGGQFTGSAVETYVGGVTGKDTIRDMYRTLFHEAAHQFVRLTGPSVPGWLNEAYASFFEGCVILSNGTVKWNQPPPGRLFPLAARLDKGWMKSADDGVKDGSGEWQTPTGAPTLRMLVSANYEWGPPWYAPTWGVVYFLFNFRAEDGRPIYREALHRYYESFKGAGGGDRIAHFEEIVLQGSPLSPVKTIDELTPIWKTWILDLRDRHTGKKVGGGQLAAFGDAAVERKDWEAALEFYTEALLEDPGNIHVLWLKGQVLEQLRQRPRAAATYRELERQLTLAGQTDGDLYDEVTQKIRRFDPLAQRYQELQDRFALEGLALAKDYETRELPTMAMEIARRMSGSFSLPAVLAYYTDLARRTGKSLARWRLAYDETSLAGWSGATESYQAYGETIRAQVPEEKGSVLTRELVCDVTFDADFSLEAEMRVQAKSDDEKYGYTGSWMGLCFGHKGNKNFHAVLLHPDGFMDISTSRGGTWEVRDHRNTAVGGEWHKLRIDVTADKLDVFLDDLYVRELEFANAETLRGAFGLITGAGEALYRNVRVLARDSFDPAAAVERQISLERIAEDAALRQTGTFAGRVPPELQVRTWVQGEPQQLEGLRGKPVVVAFWSPAQDRVIPTASYLAHLVERGEAAGVKVIVLSDGGTVEGELREYLDENPIPGAHIGIDQAGGLTYGAYWVKAGYHGIPRIVLIDGDGRVVFEGDPGLESGIGWEPGTETYADPAFDRLVGAR